MTRILMVLTSCDKNLAGGATVNNPLIQSLFLEAHNHQGWYLPEAAHPYYTFKAAGFDVDFTSPKGANPPVDEYSVKTFIDDESTKFLQDPEAKQLLANTKPIKEVDPEQYDAIFYVGGHGPVIDLPTNPANIELANKVCFKHINFVLVHCTRNS
jgi:hypothetical protein